MNAERALAGRRIAALQLSRRDLAVLVTHRQRRAAATI